MDRHFEKEKSSRKSRDEREKERESSKDHRDRERHRDRDHKHRTRDNEEEDYHRSDKHHRLLSKDDKHHHYHRSERESKRERSHERREGSKDREGSRDLDSRQDRAYEPRSEREGSKDRVYDRGVKREKSYEPRDDGEELVERARSQKRKERGGSEDYRDGDGGDKRIRVSDERKERRRFEDKVEMAKDVNGKEEERRERRKFEDSREVNKTVKDERREKRKFEGRVKEERDLEGVGEDDKHSSLDAIKVKKEAMVEPVESAPSNAISNGSGSVVNGAVPEPLNMASNTVPSLDPTHLHHTKVSSIYTTNENKGVSITRSHEVPRNTSSDGTSSTAGKSGNLSLDAIAKAKKALQMQKELNEKIKKFPLLSKGASSSQDGGPQLGSREGFKVPSSGSIGVPPSASASVQTPVTGMPPMAGLTTPNFEAVKRAQELAAKMGFRQDPEFAPLINMFPGQVAADVPVQLKPAKAPVLRLDALGREIDEHGNLVNLTKPSNLSTLKVNINKQKQEAFQILKPELEVDPESNPFFDAAMGINKSKLLRPKRMTFQFVEEGKWAKEAEMLKLKSQFGEAQAKELKAKQAQLARAKAEPDINPNLIEVSERVVVKEKPKDPIPEIEWWDAPLLQSGNYGDVADSITAEDKLKMEKITIYIEHPRPIDPPAEPAPPPPQPLKLTKKEQKKLRTQRRLAREKDKQEMIRQGLLEPPKPKVKMSNLMKVLGSEATQDPTRLEMEIRSAAAEREQAHVDRNIARKLTPAERREKKERKLFDDPNSLETIVSVYRINDLSHPQTRFKVDINAQENRLTGCAVISDGICVVVVEGGIKSIKRYGKLMLKRINWAAAVENQEDEDDEDEEKPINKCVLVWQGSAAKPSFNRFTVHNCRTEAASRKILSDAGVAHYWDLAANFSDDQM